jgi:hypothetical protein
MLIQLNTKQLAFLIASCVVPIKEGFEIGLDEIEGVFWSIEKLNELSENELIKIWTDYRASL